MCNDNKPSLVPGATGFSYGNQDGGMTNLALQQQLRNQQMDALEDKEIEQKQRLAKIHEQNQKKFYLKERTRIYEEISKQMKDDEAVQLNNRLSELQEGKKIVKDDIQRKKTYDKEFKLRKKDCQEQYKKDLIRQVYEKTVRNNREDANDPQYALSK